MTAKKIEFPDNSERKCSSYYTRLKVGSYDDFACIYSVTASVSSVVSPFFYSSRQRKVAVKFFLPADHLAKVVLAERVSLTPCNSERTFLNFVQYENLLNIYFQCKRNGTISWVYNDNYY